MRTIFNYRDCSGCPLSGSFSTNFIQHQVVPGAEVLIIGEQPKPAQAYKSFWDTQEGSLLKSVLLYHGINNVQYITAIGCHTSKKLTATQSKKCATVCTEWFLYELSQNYKYTITLGNVAARALTGDTTVSKLRIGPPRQLGATKVIHTVAPGACLVNESQFPFLVTDIGKIVNSIEVNPLRQYQILQNDQEAVEYLYKIKPGDEITVDIETATEKDISFEHPEKYQMLCIGMKINDEIVTVIPQIALSHRVYSLMARKLKIASITAHNAKFDLLGLRPHIGKQLVSFDTMLASYVFDERSGVHSLKYLAQEFLGAPKWEEEVGHQAGTSKNFGNVDSSTLYRYNAYDVHYTYLLKKMYEKRLNDDQEALKLFKLLIDASNTLADIEHNGLQIDLSRLNEVKNAMQDSIFKRKECLIKSVCEKVGLLDQVHGYNPNSPKQTKEAFLRMGVEVSSTNKEALDKIVEVCGEDSLPGGFAKMLLDYRSEQKLFSTYVEGIESRLYKGKVHPSFLLHGTTSGRLSCRNPNVQNIPRGSVIKELFIPSPGKVFFHADYSQAELRVISWLSKDKYFIEILNDPNRDIFDELVGEIFPGMTRQNTDPKEFKETRTLIKTYVYGLSYGRTAYGIARGFNMPVEEAKAHMKAFFNVIPDIIKWQNRIKNSVKHGEVLTTPNGRRRRYNLITDNNEHKVMNEALAFTPQSIASDMTLKAAVNLNNRKDFKAEIVNLVHDDIICECFPEDVENNMAILKEEMLASAYEIVGDYIKFDVDGTYGERWSDL